MKKIVLMISAFLFVQPALADATETETVHVTPCSGAPDGIIKLKSGREIKCRGGKIDNGSVCVGPKEMCGAGPTTGGQPGGTSTGSKPESGTGATESGSESGSSGQGETGGGTQTGGTAPPTTQPAAPAPETPTAPPLPVPTPPKGLDPDLIAKFGEQIQKVRIAYQKILQKLEREAKEAEIKYANDVIYCEEYFAGYEQYLKQKREKCNQDALVAFENKVKKIQSAMQGAITAYNQAIQNIKEAIAKEAGIKAEELPDAPDLSKPIPSLCYVDNKWSLCAPNPSQPSSDGANNQNGGGTTNNNSSTTNNSTVNNNNSSTTNNNNSSTTVINNGNNSENQGKDYSGFLGGIQKTLDSILAKIGNGGKDKSSETGSGDKGQENGNENGNDDKNKEGNQISEYCNENPNSVQCANVGTAEEINHAINQAKGEGRGFNIDEHKGVLPGFNRTRDFVEMGSCPPPKTVNIFGTAHQFSYQPLCDVAIRIRPIVVFAGIFMAALMARSAIMSR